MREKKKKWTHVAELLSRAARRFKFEDKIVLGKFWDAWAEIAGEATAMHARPSKWRRKILVVTVDHPTWFQELSFLKCKIIERLREEFPEAGLKDIRMEIGQLPAYFDMNRKEVKPVKFKDLGKDEKEFIEQAVKEISDENVREAARKAMEKGMGRQ